MPVIAAAAEAKGRRIKAKDGSGKNGKPYLKNH
jgi:hypothetical protein